MRSDETATSLSDELDVIVVRLDEHGDVVTANGAAREVFGDAVATGEPFDACFVGDVVSGAVAAVAEGSRDPRSVRAPLRATGEVWTVSVTPRPAGADPEVAAVCIVLSDASRDESEEPLRHRETVLRELHEIMADNATDVEGRVRALLALGRREIGTGYGALSRIDDDRYLFEIVDAVDDGVAEGDVVPLEATNCERTAATRESVVLDDVARDAPELTEKAGFTEWGVACYLGAPVLVDGEIHGTLCFYDTAPRDDPFEPWQITLVDMMARWLGTEMERGQAVDRLERQNDRLERFASVASHDLRNPLAVIVGSLDAVAEGDDEALARSRRATDRMTQLIDDLLVLARAGDEVDGQTRVDLAGAAEAAADVVATGDARITVELAGTVDADETRLGQLFENLLRNALEHGTDGDVDDAGALTVQVGMLDDGFYVADDGLGIPSEHHDEVFEDGFTTTEAGTGLGLAIVEDVAAAHGWTVTVTESEDGGARFEVRGLGRDGTEDGPSSA